jgi:hypothetical protein
MILKRETPEAIEERGTGSTKYARDSGRATGKRKAIAIFLLVLCILLVNIISLSQSGLVGSGGPGTSVAYLAMPILTVVWLIAAVVRVLRKRQAARRSGS